MRETTNWGLGKTLRHLRVIKLSKLMRRGLGTKSVERMADAMMREVRVNPGSEEVKDEEREGEQIDENEG